MSNTRRVILSRLKSLLSLPNHFSFSLFFKITYSMSVENLLTREIPRLVLVEINNSNGFGSEGRIRELLSEIIWNEFFISWVESEARREAFLHSKPSLYQNNKINYQLLQDIKFCFEQEHKRLWNLIFRNGVWINMVGIWKLWNQPWRRSWEAAVPRLSLLFLSCLLQLTLWPICAWKNMIQGYSRGNQFTKMPLISMKKRKKLIMGISLVFHICGIRVGKLDYFIYGGKLIEENRN